MLEVRDPAIKLFGKTIPLLSDEAEVNSIVSGEELSGDSNEDESSDSEPGRKEIVQETDKGAEDIKSAEIIQKVEPPTSEKPKSNLLNDVKLNDNEQDTEEDNVMESGEDVEKEKDDEKKNPEEKTMKKPDKILLCPRCNSMETKFCYYNNYNVNQPRHFCKSCQRYWTAGGTMRNVPVGAGRRRNKSSASRYCELSVSDALQAAAPINLPNGAYNQHYHHRHHHPLPVGSPNTHGTVLTFGSSTDSPLCQSMASMLNLTGEKKESAVVTKSDFRMGCRENGCDDNRPAASATATRTVAGSEEGGDGKIDSSNEHLSQNINGYANHQIPGGFPGFQWPYGFVPFPTGLVPSAGFPMPFYPPPSYWNGVAPVPWTTTTTVRPWVVSSSSCSTAPISPGSNPTSPTLGKHSREGETLNQERSSSVLVPKILRIDDPEEAAKSSIWTTLGIKKEKVDHVSKGGFFKGLQSKKKNDVEKTKDCSVLNANPAALARSITLQERA